METTMTDLATIRRAYRYVVAYERRVLDAITNVDKTVREAGFIPHRWWPLYRAFPSHNWAPDRWAWDHIPCYAFRVKWHIGASNTAGNKYVLVDHVADTAFEQKRLGDSVEPDPLDGLAPETESRSILRWFTIELNAPLPDNIWRLDWPILLAKQLNVSIADVFPNAETLSPLRRSAGPLETAALCVDLSKMLQPQDLDEQFITPLRAVIQGSGI